MPTGQPLPDRGAMSRLLETAAEMADRRIDGARQLSLGGRNLADPLRSEA